MLMSFDNIVDVATGSVLSILAEATMSVLLTSSAMIFIGLAQGSPQFCRTQFDAIVDE